MIKRSLILPLLAGGVGAAVYFLAPPMTENEVSYVTAEATEGELQEVVTTSGSLQAVVTVEVGTQLSGRISELFVDFNDSVSKGQTIAKLDPQSFEARRAEASASLEMARAGVLIKEAELERSLAELDDAQANLAVLTARRDGALARYEAAVADSARKRNLGERRVITLEEQEIAELNDRIAAAALREAEAIVDAHRIKLSVARANVARQEADLVIGRANIPQKKAVLELAEVELQRTVILAPIDGVIIDRNVSEGQTVAASLEAPTLFTIAQDLTDMELHARVDETDIGLVKKGQLVEFAVDAYPDRVFSGEVTQVRLAPEIVQNVVTYTVVIKTRNDELLLLPGMTARIRILVMKSGPVLTVPIAALDFRPVGGAAGDDGSGSGPERVWVLRNDRQPKPVAVNTGMRDRTHAAVTSGALKSGDRVITSAFATRSDRRVFGIKIGF